MPIRRIQILLVALIVLYMTLVVVNNLTDYTSNFMFVSSVTSMTDTFTEDVQSWRAIKQPIFHHIFYVTIIIIEAIITIMCLIGISSMYRNRYASMVRYQDSKKWSIYGISLGICLWFGGFISIGGEWFLMWQSNDWNGTPTAFRNAIFFLLTLLFVTQKNDQPDQS